MARGGVLGNGCKVAYSLSSPITWVEIEEVTDVVFPTWQADKVANNVHSATNKLKRNMPGLIEVGDPSFTVLSDFDPSTAPDQAKLIDLNKTGENVWWRFEVPVNRQKTLFRGVEFQAGVLNFSPATPIDDRQTTQYTLTFDGEDVAWDLAAGASEIV
jgi:hypothetical protein